MAAVAEVIASAFASGMCWAGTIEGHRVYSPPSTAALTGNQLMTILERFVADNPDWLRALRQFEPRVPMLAGVSEKEAIQKFEEQAIPMAETMEFLRPSASVTRWSRCALPELWSRRRPFPW